MPTGFCGVELAFQRLAGVVKTEVGYSQGHSHDPKFRTTNWCAPELLTTWRLFGSSMIRKCVPIPIFSPSSGLAPVPPLSIVRSGIYYYNETPAGLAEESKESKQRELNGKVVTEILPAKRFYRAEEYHQQYLEKGGRHGLKQSAEKGCTEPIRCG